MRRLRWRIALTVAVAVLTSTVAATCVAYYVQRNGMRAQFTDTAVQHSYTDAQQATKLAKAEPTNAAAATAVAKFLNRQDQVSYDILTPNPTGVMTCSAARCYNPRPSFVPHSPGSGFFALQWADGGRQLVIARSIESTSTQRLTLIEYYYYGDELDQLTRLRNDLLVLDGVGLVAAIALGLAVSIGISRPVLRTAHAAQRLGAGDLDTRIPVRGSGELAELATNFNAMAQRLSDTLNDLRLSQSLQQRFVADVSHELRTPLSAMVAADEGLDSADPALRARATALVREQTRRMATMVDDLLEMSRFDSGQTSLDLETVDLAELARDVVRTVAPSADVRLAAFGDVIVDVDARRVHTILRNLIVNAVQHGEPPVEVVVDARADPVVVTVADDGPGVPAEIADTVFDRFVRADTARASTDGATSTGLGLAIAAENAHLHGATLEVAHSGRSTFLLHLPRARVGDPQRSL